LSTFVALEARNVDGVVAAIAERQHGVVSRQQLLGSGVTPDSIQHRVRRGRLHRIHAGVFAVGHRAVTLEGRWSAAVLAYSPGALLGLRDAAALWSTLDRIERPIDVLVEGDRRRRPGLAPHRAAKIHPDDRAMRRGIPVTSVARTLLDLCDVVPRKRVERAFNEADRLHLLDIAQLEALLARSPGRKGLAFLGSLVAAYRGPSPKLRSALEQRFLAMCREAGLPEPETNVRVAGVEVDMLWREAGVVVELDGYEYHGGRAPFEEDRRRDGVLLDAHLQPRRITYKQLEEDAAGQVASVSEMIEGRLGRSRQISRPG
jgi:very-short-patch-repair endonuclease